MPEKPALKPYITVQSVPTHNIGLLEQLMGSQSLATTLERFFVLRRFELARYLIVLL